MKKVSVFTVLTCFLAGTASFPCYAGNMFGSPAPDKPVDESHSKGFQTQPSTSVGRGAGRGSVPAQPPMSVGRGVGRGALPPQQPTSIEQGGRGVIPSSQPKPGPNSALVLSPEPPLPEIHGTFDDVDSASLPPPQSEITKMTPAELALYEQWIADGKISGISLTSASLQSTVPPVGGSTIPSSYAIPLPTTSLVSNRDTEASDTSRRLTSSSSAMDNVGSKDDNALSHYIPSGAIIIEKENYRLSKVAMVCSLTEWDYYSVAARNDCIKKLYDPELVATEEELIRLDPERYISRLRNGLAWAKKFLTHHGGIQKKEREASLFRTLIDNRLSAVIGEVEEQIKSGKQLSDLSYIIRCRYSTKENNIFFSVEKRLGKLILAEIPGQEL